MPYPSVGNECARGRGGAGAERRAPRAWRSSPRNICLRAQRAKIWKNLPCLPESGRPQRKSTVELSYASTVGIPTRLTYREHITLHVKPNTNGKTQDAMPYSLHTGCVLTALSRGERMRRRASCARRQIAWPRLSRTELMQVAQAGRPGDPPRACAGSSWELGPPCRVFENLPKVCQSG